MTGLWHGSNTRQSIGRVAPVLDVMKPFTAVVMLRRSWCDFTFEITPLDGSVGVKYIRKNVLKH